MVLARADRRPVPAAALRKGWLRDLRARAARRLDPDPRSAGDAGPVVPAMVGGAKGHGMSGHPGSGARDRILGRIGDILGERQEAALAAYERIPREYRIAATLSPDACLDLLTERLQHYQVDVYRAEPATLSRTIATALTARIKTRIVVPVDIDPAW